jgi:hypothetical protein
MVQVKASSTKAGSSQEEDSGCSPYIEVLHSCWEHLDVS